MHAWPRCSAQRIDRCGVVTVFKDGSSVGFLDGGAEGLIVGTLVGAADGLSVAQQGSQISRARIYIPAQAQARIKSQDQDSIFQLETILQSFNKAPRSEAKVRGSKAAYSSVSLSGAALADLTACVLVAASAPATVGVMAAPWARPSASHSVAYSAQRSAQPTAAPSAGWTGLDSAQALATLDDAGTQQHTNWFLPHPSLCSCRMQSGHMCACLHHTRSQCGWPPPASA